MAFGFLRWLFSRCNRLNIFDEKTPRAENERNSKQNGGYSNGDSAYACEDESYKVESVDARNPSTFKARFTKVYQNRIITYEIELNNEDVGCDIERWCEQTLKKEYEGTKCEQTLTKDCVNTNCLSENVKYKKTINNKNENMECVQVLDDNYENMKCIQTLNKDNNNTECGQILENTNHSTFDEIYEEHSTQVIACPNYQFTHVEDIEKKVTWKRGLQNDMSYTYVMSLT